MDECAEWGCGMFAMDECAEWGRAVVDLSQKFAFHTPYHEQGTIIYYRQVHNILHVTNLLLTRQKYVREVDEFHYLQLYAKIFHL